MQFIFATRKHEEVQNVLDIRNIKLGNRPNNKLSIF